MEGPGETLLFLHGGTRDMAKKKAVKKKSAKKTKKK
jgi:hypothetical protein